MEAAGLDPSVGFYHRPDGDRPSLACDFVEELRHEVIDRLVLRLVNLKVIQPHDFDEPGENRGTRLRPGALRRFVTHYEKALIGARAEDDLETGYRSVFLKQLAALLDSLHTGEPYRSHLETLPEVKEPEPCST